MALETPLPIALLFASLGYEELIWISNGESNISPKNPPSFSTYIL